MTRRELITAAGAPRYAGSTIFDDHRRLPEARGLDAVVIATSNHWHAANHESSL